ncbi:MAG: hypothetical protein HWD59_12980 [Coxiellaceae bacterium]|nr:MAG: hypothetical protein HWD59_12980 [Coxiellaceae bacterium]
MMDLIDELPLYALPLYITQRIHNNYLNDLLLIWSSHHGKDFRILQYAYVLDENGRLSIPFQALHLEVFAPRFLYFDIWKLKVDEVMQLLKDCGDRGLFYISTLGRYATPNVTKDLGSFWWSVLR